MDDYIEVDARILAHYSAPSAIGWPEAPVRYEWVGGKVANIGIFELPDGINMENAQGRVFRLGDLRLRVVEVRYWHGGIYVMRESPQAAAYAWWRRAVRLADLCYRRCIITLAVWRLADYHEAILPSWRDIRVVKRLRQLYERGAK